MEEVLDNHLTSEEAKNIIIRKDHSIYRFYDIQAVELGEKVDKYLISKGYKLEKGTKTEGIYGKGSNLLRILLGAFAKRFQWEISIEEDSISSVLKFSKLAKGYVGGIIGVQQVKNEYNRITGLLKNYCEKLNEREVKD